MIKYHNHLLKYFKQYTVVRYIIGGGMSAVVNLSILYILNSLIGVYYLTASIISFMAAFFVSWAFHKFLTFRDHSTDNMHKQGALYFLTSLFGLSLNTLILYISVDLIHMPVLLGAIVAGILTAFCTFFISKHIVFKVKEVKNIKEVLDEFL